MEIKRDSYLQQLISYQFDGLVKVITGARQIGKTESILHFANEQYTNVI